MPKKSPLTPWSLTHLGQQLHDTRMSIYATKQALNYYLNKDTKLVERAQSIYDFFCDLESECGRELGTKYVPPPKPKPSA